MSHRTPTGVSIPLAALILALTLTACAGEPVTLLTGGLSNEPGMVGCYTSGTAGDLVVDSDAGSAIIEQGGRRVAVIWPVGFVGRRSGAEVEVLDGNGAVVARTGSRVYLPGGYPPQGGFLACGQVLPPR